MEVKCFVSLEDLAKVGKIFVTEEEVVERHLFKKENPHAHAVPHISGWVAPGDLFLRSYNCFGDGISREADRPLIRDDQGRVLVRIRTTTTGVDVYIAGMPPGFFFQVNGPELTAEEATLLAGESIKLTHLEVGDMYSTGVGRWADHR